MTLPFPYSKTDIDYPDSDGLPMAESDAARDYLIYGVESLSIYFQNQPNVYISGNLFIYYEEGNPKAVVAPDVFVVFGVEKKKRPSYKVWEEQGKVPNFVLEITSKSTASEDRGTKRGLYAYLGVQEYFQYDPLRIIWNRLCKDFLYKMAITGPFPVNRQRRVYRFFLKF